MQVQVLIAPLPFFYPREIKLHAVPDQKYELEKITIIMWASRLRRKTHLFQADGPQHGRPEIEGLKEPMWSPGARWVRDCLV